MTIKFEPKPFEKPFEKLRSQPLFVRYSFKEATILLVVSGTTLRKLIRRGRIVRVDQKISLAELDRYLKNMSKMEGGKKWLSQQSC
jgi:hypothetical protein